jgi:hypothetical protein
LFHFGCCDDDEDDDDDDDDDEIAINLSGITLS